METETTYGLSKEEFEKLPESVKSGTASYGDWKRYERFRYFSETGKMVGIRTVNDSTLWVHVDDIVSIERFDDSPYQVKLFIKGRTSPVFVVVDEMDLASKISILRTRQD